MQTAGYFCNKGRSYIEGYGGRAKMKWEYLSTAPSVGFGVLGESGWELVGFDQNGRAHFKRPIEEGTGSHFAPAEDHISQNELDKPNSRE